MKTTKTDEPDFVNAEGVKWWRNDNLTSYARKPDTRGISLDLQGWITELPNGYRSFVLTDSSGIIDANQSLEGIGGKIDQMKIAKAFDKTEP